MSHRWDCPTDYEAEREGRRAAERGMGRYSNPYSESGWTPCGEAEAHWQSGYRTGERARREEREEEERMEERAMQRRREAADEEAYWMSQQQEEQYPEQEYPEEVFPEGAQP